jgi:hypothetical protein
MAARPPDKQDMGVGGGCRLGELVGDSGVHAALV